MNFKLYYNPYKTGSPEWKSKDAEVSEKFKNDALHATGLHGHEKAEEAYSLAWKHGFEGGFKEVFAQLVGIANMFKSKDY